MRTDRAALALLLVLVTSPALAQGPVILRDPTGAVFGTLTNPIFVNPGGETAGVGVGAAADAAAAAGGAGSATAQMRRITTQLDTIDNIVSGNGINLTQVGNTNVVNGGVAGVLSIGGNVAIDQPITANPITIGGRASTTVPGAVSTAGDVQAFWLSLNGSINGILRDSVGDSVMDDATNTVRVNIITGSTAGPSDTDDGSIAGAQSTGLVSSLNYVWDTVGLTWIRAANGDATHDTAVLATGPQMLFEAKDFDGATLPNPASLENRSVRGAASLWGVQYAMFVSEDGSLQYGTATTPMVVGGPAAHNVAVSGNPILNAGYASAAAPTDVGADGRVVNFWALRSGAQVTNPSFAGVLQSTGNGTVGGGVPRVAIASDNTAFTVNVGTIVPGTGATSLAKAEDNPAGDGYTGVASFGVYKVTPAQLAGADGDFTTAIFDANGLMYTTSAQSGAWAVTATGQTASGAANAGNPIKIGGVYNSTQPTVANAQTVDLQATIRGALIIATGVETPHYICDSGCTPGGSTADASPFSFTTTSVNPAAYVVDETATNAVVENGVAAARMNSLRIPYVDHSKDSSGLVPLLARLNALVDDANGNRLASPIDPAGFSIRVGPFNRIVGPANPLPVSLAAPPDPCYGRKGNVAVSQTATTRYIVGKPGQLIAICSGRLSGAAAEVFGFIEGTGTNCATGETAVSGSTTDANSESFAANSGWAQGVGVGTVATTNIAGNDFCLQQSTANRVTGELLYVYYTP